MRGAPLPQKAINEAEAEMERIVTKRKLSDNGSTSLLDLDVKRILLRVEALTGIKLPVEVIELSIVPGEDVLHVRFREPMKLEIGEPLHPKIHLYRDRDSGEITAIEIINPDEILKGDV
jgi:hypothetical protein